MSTTIQVKRSAVQGKVPLTTDIELGEIAINTYDGKLFIKKNVGGTESVVDVGGGGLSAGDLLTEIKTVDGSGSGLDADLLDGLESTDFARVNTLSGNSDDYLSVTRNSTDPTLYVNQISSGDIARFFKGTDAANTSSGTQVTITNSGGITATGSVSATGTSVFTSTDLYSPAIRLDSQTASGSWSRLDLRNTAVGAGNEFILYQTNTGGAGIRNLNQDTPITFTVNDGGTPTEVMRIEGATSRVGILTTTPSQPLHVVGAIKTTSGLLFGSTESYMYENAADSIAWRIGSDGPFITMADGGSNVVNLFNVSAALALGAANSEKMRITSAGYILIGRTTTTLGGGAGYDLQIGSGSTNSGMTFHAGTTSLSDIQFADGTSGNASYRGLIRYDHNGDYMTLWTGAAERIRIGSTGSVGIGSVTLPQKLTVGGSIATLGSGTGILTDVGSAATPTHSFSSDPDTGMFSPATNQLGFATAGVERINIDSTGTVTFNNAIKETVYVVTGTTPSLDPANGTVQTWTLSGNSTPTAGSFDAGESMTLMIDDGSAYTITWPSVTWVNNGGTAPTLATTGYTVVALWKVSTTLYGALVGDGS